MERTWSELSSSGKVAGLDTNSWHDTGLDGDRTSVRLTTTGGISLGLDTGTSGVITRSETRHAREGKAADGVVMATRGDDVHKADDDALRDIVSSPTKTLLN